MRCTSASYYNTPWWDRDDGASNLVATFKKIFFSTFYLLVFLPRLSLGLGSFSSIDLQVSSAVYPSACNAIIVSLWPSLRSTLRLTSIFYQPIHKPMVLCLSYGNPLRPFGQCYCCPPWPWFGQLQDSHWSCLLFDFWSIGFLPQSPTGLEGFLSTYLDSSLFFLRDFHKGFLRSFAFWSSQITCISSTLKARWSLFE